MKYLSQWIIFTQEFFDQLAMRAKLLANEYLAIRLFNPAPLIPALEPGLTQTLPLPPPFPLLFSPEEAQPVHHHGARGEA